MEVETKSSAVRVTYCPHCSFPPEYCSLNATGKMKRCRPWLEETFGPESGYYQVEEGGEVSVKSGGGEAVEGKKKSSKRGGQETIAKKEMKVVARKEIVIVRQQRGRKKATTIIRGVGTFDIKPKEVSKAISKKFACSASVSNEGEISVTGDVEYDVAEMMVQKYKIAKPFIFRIENGIRKPFRFY
jgi:density-regulated protein DRP1